MSGLSVRFSAVVFLLVFLSTQSSAMAPTRLFCPPAVASLPSNPDDPYYQSFQTVPPARDTASKLMTNFLHILPVNMFSRIKRQSPPYVEDVVVVMDGSGSVGSCEFEKGKQALKHIMGLSSRPGNDVKYAAVTFASSASVNFKFLTSSEAANEIMKIPYPGGVTNTQAALTEAKTLMNDYSSGCRFLSNKVVFLVTDGPSNIQKQVTIPKAQALKNSGVKIYVVAVGGYISEIDEMVKVASSPPENFLFRVKNLQGFWNIVKLVIQQVSPDKYTIANGQFDPPC